LYNGSRPFTGFYNEVEKIESPNLELDQDFGLGLVVSDSGTRIVAGQSQNYLVADVLGRCVFLSETFR
jgi:hypothetical protein